MRVEWDDELTCYLPDQQSGIEIPYDLWKTYDALLTIKMELEQDIRALSPPSQRDLSDLSHDELIAMVQSLTGTRDSGTASAAAPIATVEPLITERPPACPKNPAGKHIAASYGRTSNGTLLGQCKCGAMIQNPDCPHTTQAYRNKAVVCNDCGKVLVHNTGYTDNDADHPAPVNPEQFRG